jgi:general secretion pathway protein L
MTPNLLTAEIDFNKFWQWWTQELKALIPPKLLNFLGAETKQPVFLQLYDSKVSLFEKTPEGNKLLACFTLDAEGKRRQEQFFVEHPNLADCEKILYLHKCQGLSRQVVLPVATQDNLRQVFGYEMNRYTPFNEPDVYYDVQILAKNKEVNQLTAELTCVPKVLFNDIYHTVRDWGMEIHAAGYEASIAKHYHLLPEELRPQISRGPLLARNILAATFVLLLAAVMILPIYQQSRNLADLEEQLSVAGKKVKEIEKIKSRAKALLNDVTKLTALKVNEPSMVIVLNELTELLPEDTWLNSFQYANRKIQIQGLSPSASALIGILEESPHFKQVSFISPVIPDRESGQDRFQIAMNVTSAAEKDAKKP